MKRALPFLLLAAPFFVHAHGAHIEIDVTDAGFSPKTITVPVGTEVEFINTGNDDHWPASNNHPTHTLYTGFDPRRPLTPGEAWSFTFDKAGSWGMHDHLMPQHVGTVIVSASSTEPVVTTHRSELVRWFSGVWTWATHTWDSLVARRAPQTTTISLTFTNTDPTPAEVDKLYADFSFSCNANDFDCAQNALKAEVRKEGPRVAVAILERLQADGRVNKQVDEHQLGHQIGRATAEVFGATSEAFLLCPMSALNGGCQHGFFEYVLGRSKTAAAAADQICAVLRSESYSSKQQFDCYHGVGHGIMMAEAYDLNRSLADCDSLSEDYARVGCWQGVFMENVNGSLSGQVREGVFSETDPLAPCDTVEEKYAHECYINHAGWLIHVSHTLSEAAKDCLAVTGSAKVACLQSLALMVTNPSWQSALGAKEGTLEERAWQLCKVFPDSVRNQCVTGAIDNLLNFDGLDTSEAGRFCKLVDANLSAGCYQEIGVNLQRQATNPSQITASCAALTGHEAQCETGAGL